MSVFFAHLIPVRMKRETEEEEEEEAAGEQAREECRRYARMLPGV